MFNKKKSSVKTVYVSNDSVGLYSIKDVPANQFGPIMFCKNHDIAIRQFNNIMAKGKYDGEKQKEQLGYNPFSESDFTLYCLGVIDLSDGVISPNIEEVAL